MSDLQIEIAKQIDISKNRDGCSRSGPARVPTGNCCARILFVQVLTDKGCAGNFFLQICTSRIGAIFSCAFWQKTAAILSRIVWNFNWRKSPTCPCTFQSTTTEKNPFAFEYVPIKDFAALRGFARAFWSLQEWKIVENFTPVWLANKQIVISLFLLNSNWKNSVCLFIIFFQSLQNLFRKIKSVSCVDKSRVCFVIFRKSKQ